MPREISSIIPQVKQLGDKKVIAGRTTTQQPEEIDFHYDLSAYDSFEKEGFNPPPQSNERFDKLVTYLFNI